MENNYYKHLNAEELAAELERTETLYWNAVDALGSLRVVRAMLMNELQEKTHPDIAE
jgi:hypothetical protein